MKSILSYLGNITLIRFGGMTFYLVELTFVTGKYNFFNYVTVLALPIAIKSPSVDK